MKRSPALLLLLLAAIAFQLYAFGTHYLFRSSLSAGFVFMDDTAEPGRIVAIPVTVDAKEAVRGLGELPRLVAINGTRPTALPSSEPHIFAVQRAVRNGTNHFAFRGPKSSVVSFSLEPDYPTIKGVPGYVIIGILYHLLGLVFFAAGVIVWWVRPEDRSARALFILGVAASVNFTFVAPTTKVSYTIAGLCSGLVPFLAYAGLALAIHFTGHRPTKKLRWLLRAAFCDALAIWALVCIAFWYWSCGVGSDIYLRVLFALIGVTLAVAAGAMVYVSWQASRPPHPVLIRRRARLFGIAAVLGFLVPGVQVIILPIFEYYPTWIVLPNLLALSCFPAVIAYAILRYQLFDLRIFIRRGVVFVVLSLIVSSTYVALVFAAWQLLGKHAQSPVFIGVSVAVLMLVFGVLQIRVQRFVDRFIYRTRYVYADALSSASESLARSRSLDAATETVRTALMKDMALTRAMLLVRDPDSPSLQVIVLGAVPDPQTGHLPQDLGDNVHPEDHPPLQTALTSRKLTAVYDREHQRAAFFADFGIEAILPFNTLGAKPSVGLAGDERPLGALLLGPKKNGRPLEREDLTLLFTLSNQLAVAIENALAFAEIERLKNGLEDLVAERTRALEEALEELKTTESQLIESEKKAMLTRLVAGIVHEINSPLGALTSSSDTIQRALLRVKEEIDGQANKRIDRSLSTGLQLTDLQKTSSARITKLLESLKQFVSLDQAELQKSDIRPGIEGALTLLAGDLEDRITIERDFEEPLPRVRCNPQRLNQVFLHLLRNASAAIGERGTIRISAASVDSFLEIVIADDGCGMSEELRGKVFEFGFTEKGKRVGLKLGLPTSKRTIEELGGTLSIESSEGNGTSARIRLPQSG